MVVAIISTFLSTLSEQTIGRILPININPISNYFHPRPVIEDSANDWASCSMLPPLSTTERTKFGTGPGGCVVYGYPSTGGVLVKEADLLDMLFLSLSRSQESQRSPSVEEEDRFCHLLRRTGAKWWSSREDRLEAQLGAREMTAEEEKVLVFGWPTDGVGVWVLRYESDRQLPKDFGRMSLAMNMEERIQMMREYGATFVEDVTQVEELRDS
ncbi:hypothetical protein AbraIFM66951_007900 [Aspergillus brasiliensis]|uniref:Uncharacterized protein n=1 Tax=Aspergillus brasiliensis TaxID=319629 RepID=A0A9W6DS08_9EURO|nr:hypothetical protein AbraCBS73388_003210 [Aspergillus brasiliensis]GKZ51882.1 hypothetical protein AbraIFM66951_007900 [Aspergillus brasiliensis]